jgi:hypothetical protein
MAFRRPSIASSYSAHSRQTAVSTATRRTSSSSLDNLVGTLPREVEQVMDEVRSAWSFMTLEKFNGVPLALELWGGGSVATKDYDALRGMLARLEVALEIVVQDYFHGFNQSISTFTKLVETITGASYCSSSRQRTIQPYSPLLPRPRRLG